MEEGVAERTGGNGDGLVNQMVAPRRGVGKGYQSLSTRPNGARYASEAPGVGLEGGLPLCGNYNPELVGKIKQYLINHEVSPNFTENAMSVLKDRYLRKDESGRLEEDGKGLVARVASYVAYAEQNYNNGNGAATRNVAERFYKMLANREFIPNSPALMNAGREMGMLSACFVLPLEDSIRGIFSETGSSIAMVQKAGGGTGLSFDRLRPTGDYIKGSGGTTSGPIAFWKALAEITNAIQQGSFRRGANMGMMSIDRPDILKFVNAKSTDDAFSNYNISVKLPDEWMNNLLSDPGRPHVVVNPRTGSRYYLPKKLTVETYSLKDLLPVEKFDSSSEVYTYRDMWNLIVENAHEHGEPGIAFIDRMNRDNPTPNLGNIEATNPCGEEPLLPYEACNLGHINLDKITKGGVIDWENYKRLIHDGVRFLDDIIDMNHLPLQQIVDMVRGNRAIGLGVTGFADALINLGVRYGSEESYHVADQLASFLKKEAFQASEDLAKERGVFPNWEGSIYDENSEYALEGQTRALRNSRVLTVAPTGTTGIIVGAYGGGIESLFNVVYTHRDSSGNKRNFLVSSLMEDLLKEGIDTNRVLKDLGEGHSLKDLEYVPERIRQIYVGSHDVTPEQHVKMQAVWQKHVDASISKTINLSHDASVEEVDAAYRLAFTQGCKGLTVYRDGSRKMQPLSAANKKETLEKKVFKGSIDRPFTVPEIMPSVRIRQDTPYGNLHTHVVFNPSDNYVPIEAFGLLGQAGSEEAASLEALGRMVSLRLRSGGNLETVVDQLIGIGSGTSKSTRSGEVQSLAMGFAKALLKYIVARKYFNIEDLLLGRVDYDAFAAEVSDVVRTKEVKDLLKGKELEQGQDFLVKISPKTTGPNGKSAFLEKCPECGVNLIVQEGCRKCIGCGYSKC